uniref:Uncharacterized protein n=1 Tax=Hyaloperonospora arabidopsidis (strain Emoy2) TaxID=559515 RepID=M4BWF5_HYAAE
MKTALLREIDVQVVRVKPRGRNCPSPAYVFAIRPCSCSHNDNEPVARRQDLDHAELVDQYNVPVVHEVARTYSHCRTLYRDLQRLTDCKKAQACCCALDSCPFWSLSPVLDGLKFPRRTLFNHQTKRVFAQRTHALSALIRTVLTVLQNNYRIDHFSSDDDDFKSDTRVCKVLHTLCRFLELDKSDVEQRLLEGSDRWACKLNLRGWQSDRCNLYFQGETTHCHATSGPPVRDRKSMELSQSLATSDHELDDKYPTTTISDDNERYSLH